MSTKIQELLAKIKRTQLPVVQVQAASTEHEQGGGHSPDQRAENLRLLRAFLNANQDDLSELLKLGSQSRFSIFERGEKNLPASEARRIEKDLELPSHWLDRNNSDALFLSPTEISLIRALRCSAPDATSALIDAVKKIRIDRQ